MSGLHPKVDPAKARGHLRLVQRPAGWVVRHRATYSPGCGRPSTWGHRPMAFVFTDEDAQALGYGSGRELAERHAHAWAGHPDLGGEVPGVERA